MGWQPNPGDPRHIWNSYEFCILTQAYSDISGGPEVDLIYRLSVDQSWLSIGAGDGMVYGTSTGTFEGDVAKAGSFDAWWAPVQAEINKRLALVCPLLDPTAQVLSITVVSVGNPATFAAFQSWLKPSVKWSGSPTPPVGIYPLYGARAFFGGYGFDCGIESDGAPACRVNTPQGWKKFVLPI